MKPCMVRAQHGPAKDAFSPRTPRRGCFLLGFQVQSQPISFSAHATEMAPAARNRVKWIIARDTGEAVSNGSKSVVGAVRKQLRHALERRKKELEKSSPVSRAPQSGADSYSADEPGMSTSEEVAKIVERSAMPEPESPTVVTAPEPESPPAAVVEERMTTVTDPKSLADETLRVVDALPSPMRTNPITAIHARVNSADALKYEGSMLYKNEKGDWVVEELPVAEAISMSVATSAAQIVYPTLTMV